MVTSYANEQPVGFQNQIKNIAIVGASGQSGSTILSALLTAKQHNITAITRVESTSKLPSGLHDIKKVDYNDHISLVKALEGYDVLIITLAVTAPANSHFQLVDAAIEAGVKWIMPNEWGIDISHEEMGRDTMTRDRPIAVRKRIEERGAGKTRWVGLACGFWYEFSLGTSEALYGFNFVNKTVTFYGDGNTMIDTSTWQRVGEAVAKLLSLKVLPEDEKDNSLCLSQYSNRSAHVSSFFLSQRDMFQSVLRVTGDREEDWTVQYEDVVERYNRGQRLLKEGQMVGFQLLLYARLFYKDGSGDFNEKLDNDVLGLLEESLDEATKATIDKLLSKKKLRPE